MQKKVFIFEHNQSLEPLASYLLSLNVEAILMNGELGAGKTTLTKCIAKMLNIEKEIVSPTFNTILVYEGLVHIDAYKLTGSLSGFEDYFEDNLVVVEWSDNISHNFSHYAKVNAYLKDSQHIFEVEEV
ncbi:tRNA (adenosine(37)-N6)-threonylcarbamoyltransferase complex ATPase subunit type 1 TsaE [Mycoplasma sp. 128]|uniref:tRNA (adenosine(37)-N6)-threonylcarbamoyltransferase complex ATPase subunit type 1 TsaE n=1 Tax=Mycoplasma sp. 3341 TaxID=3447506 RepID=UPI003F6550F9